MKPHLKKQWVISKFDEEFIAKMENILNLYELAYNKSEPVICFDERPCQLIENIVLPLPMKPGKPKRVDYNYKRNGTCCLLVAFEPLTAFRMVQVVKQRTKIEYAQFMKKVCDQYTHTTKIHLVQDNLNTHTKGAFYKAFEPEQAFELAQKFQFHFTPVKASWLNMVEIELSVIARMCLNRRIPSMQLLNSEVNKLVKERNLKKATVNWQFTINDARKKLKNCYGEMTK